MLPFYSCMTSAVMKASIKALDFKEFVAQMDILSEVQGEALMAALKAKSSTRYCQVICVKLSKEQLDSFQATISRDYSAQS